MNRGTWSSKVRSTVKQRPWRVGIRKGKGRGKGGWDNKNEVVWGEGKEQRNRNGRKKT